MYITEEQKKLLFAMAKDMRTRRDLMLSLYDQSKSRKEKDHFLSLSVIQAAGEQGIHSCFRTLGLSREYANFIKESGEDLSDLLFFDAYTAEKRFLSSKKSYHNSALAEERTKARQRCRECLAVYRGYLRVFSILGLMGKYEVYKYRR